MKSTRAIDYFADFRRRDVVQAQAKEIRRLLGERPVSLMEVCGGHTAAILRFGLTDLLPDNLNLISGPGCPVCVTPRATIDEALACARRADTIVATFGDLVRVPGSEGTLEQARSEGARIEVIFGADQALEMARKHSDAKVVLVGIGFETTAPTSAAVVLEAEAEGVFNFFLLSAHKTMPLAMKWLVEAGEVHIDGFICPGHVSTIIGSKPYEFLARDHGIACAIAGFEPSDMLEAILLLVRQVVEGRPAVEIPYRRSVRPEGNRRALDILDRVFDPAPSTWRGLGTVADTGLALKETYRRFDPIPALEIPATAPEATERADEKGCRCGEVLRGVARPTDCPLFAGRCTPEEPVGACMVGAEGTCRNYYTYHVGA